MEALHQKLDTTPKYQTCVCYSWAPTLRLVKKDLGRPSVLARRGVSCCFPERGGENIGHRIGQGGRATMERAVPLMVFFLKNCWRKSVATVCANSTVIFF